jgi:hypothetical protein
MAIYQIAQFGPGKRLLSGLVRTTAFLLLYAAVLRVVDGRWLPLAFWALLGIAIFLLSLLTTFLWPREAPRYALDIDDDEIRLIWSRKVVRRVRKDHIRYVREWGRGPFRKLVVSERGPAFTRWLWGGIAVPANVSDYEQIKTQALAWLEHSKA